MDNKLVWQERFNIGVDIIDREHRKLFSILNKLLAFSEQESKSQWVCEEGVKYFKEHAMKHFSDEEKYMELIAYEDLETHRRLHRGFRENTLPALEKELNVTIFKRSRLGAEPTDIGKKIIAHARAALNQISEITKLERNGSFVYESVPGTAVQHFQATDSGVTFQVEGPEDAQITLELEDQAEYRVYVNGADAGTMKTNLGGKLSLSVELNEGEPVAVKIEKIG